MLTPRTGLLLLATLALAGCGGRHDEGRAAGNPCRDRLVAKAEAQALERLFAAGKLGPAAKVRAESSRAHPFVRANGKIVSYDRMTAWQRASFATWAASPRIDRIARHELEDADRAGAQQAKADC